MAVIVRITEARRSEHLFRRYREELPDPTLTDAGRGAREPGISPTWSIARR